MKNKAVAFLVVVSLLALPAVAFAATEFTLGGYVKMEAIWDSTQVNKNFLEFVRRNNDANFQHGRLKFTAENTRMNFTIKGPDIWGAKTTGYIEWDFDNNARNTSQAYTSFQHKAGVGLRHAMFRLNWPDTELMLGQYWSLLTEEIPETANFGACTTAGAPFIREPQIRLTQGFGLGPGKMTASIALAEPMNGLWGLALNTNQVNLNNAYGGESSEIPKVLTRVKYDADLWGKAAFWGRLRPFSVRLGGAWWRERFRAYTGLAARTFGQDNYNDVTGPVTMTQPDQQYLDHWLAEGSVFIPLIPTHTKNLAGTASLLTQWWVGAGMDGWIEDLPNNASFLEFDFVDAVTGDLVGDRELLKRWGGFVQLQYYFTNQWYTSLVWGINRAFDVNRGTWIGDGGADPIKTNQHYYATLWYRPIQALKFGLEYTYVRTDYFQNTTTGSQISDKGENHRMMFCGFFLF
jgi:hypothetical protein